MERRAGGGANDGGRRGGTRRTGWGRQIGPRTSGRSADGSSGRRATTPRDDTRIVVWIALGLVALNALVYAPVRHFDFVNWDDDTYIRYNAMVLAGVTSRGLAWAFTTGHDPYWHPLTWISHMIDVQAFGTQAGGHHVTNVVLATINTLVAFLLLRRLTGAIWASAFVAALFAVHPLRVESVAWVSERKDLLSGLFLLLAIRTYAWYVDRPAWGRYVAVVALFALGLMAKPILVTMPFALLLIDYWPLERKATLRTLIVEKTPFLLLALIASVATVVIQQRVHAVADFTMLPFSTRVSHALVSYVTYVGVTIWPAGLAAYYPYPSASPGWWIVGAAAAALAAITIAAWRARAHRYLLFGWTWYVVTMIPVIGLVQSGDQARADRFTYIPLMGLFVIVAWGLRDMAAESRARRLWLSLAAAGIVIACAVAARAQVAYWKDGATLWTRVLDVTPDNYRAHGGLGDALAAVGRYSEARNHYEQAVRLAPGVPTWHNGLAFTLAQEGQTARAIAEYQTAIRIDPAYVEARNNLAAALVTNGRTAEAIAQYEEAIRLNPAYALPRANLAIAVAGQGDLQRAINEVREALRIEPGRAEWHCQLGVYLYQAGRSRDAVEELETALRIDPSLAAARQALGILKRQD